MRRIIMRSMLVLSLVCLITIGCAAQQVVINPPIPIGTTPLILQMAPAALPNPVLVGKSYTLQLTGQGGIPPYTFKAYCGSLPDGLTLVASGAISGTVQQSAAGHSFIIGIAMSDADTSPSPYPQTGNPIPAYQAVCSTSGQLNRPGVFTFIVTGR